MFPFLEDAGDGHWKLPARLPSIPLMFSMRARKRKMDALFTHFPNWVRLDLRTWSGNHGMMRLAQKLAYRQEACFRQARIVDGDYYDGLGYGILRDEWQVQFSEGFALR